MSEKQKEERTGEGAALLPLEIAGVGSPIIDQLAHVDDAFIDAIGDGKGGMVLIDAARMAELCSRIPGEPAPSPGGSAGNTIFTLARLGVRTTFIGKIGNDAGGHFYAQRFKELGGDNSRFKRGAVANGRCLSLVTPDSERTMRTDLGAAMTLAPEEIRVSDFANCRHTHIEGYLLFNRELMFAVLNAARAAGCTISLDLASFETVQAAADILPDILKDYVNIVFANEDETAAYFGAKGDWTARALEFAKYCDVAAVKLGREGSIVASAGESHRIAPVPAQQVVDTTGAGDFWAAGFLYGWIRGLPLPECGALGSRFGSVVVEQLGTQLTDETWARLCSGIAGTRSA